MDLDIGAILNQLLPMLDYYISFFTKLLTNFAASLGIDLDLEFDLAGDGAVTDGDVQ